MRTSFVALALSVVSVVACGETTPPANTATATGAVASPTPTHATSGTEKAELGKPAPDFTLKDLDGKEVRLSSFKGKVVVLEWFNPGCPFVNKAHTMGSLKDAPKRHTSAGVVWLAVNSSAAGKQGNGLEANRTGAKGFGMDYPVLLDESGDVGKRYGATNTPHMFVVDAKGTLVYRGAIDNSPDGEGQSAEGGKLVNFVDAAIVDLGAGRAVATSETKAYGCGVKYAH